MGVDAPALFNSSLEMFRPVCPGEAENVVARPGEGLGDACAETFGRASEKQTALDRAGHRFQIHRRMLAMMTIWANQPAVKASVRAAGIPAE